MGVIGTLRNVSLHLSRLSAFDLLYVLGLEPFLRKLKTMRKGSFPSQAILLVGWAIQDTRRLIRPLAENG